MLIIIDANLFSNMASGDEEYRPLVVYVSFGKGSVAYGGKKYEKELAKHKKFLQLLLEWEKKRKTIRLDKGIVDKNEVFLEGEFKKKDFDDHHILAMVIYSGAEIVCSIDRGLHALVDACYSSVGRMKIDANCVHRCSLKKPKIYQGKEHAGLLS
jgi:hypothetical protein